MLAETLTSWGVSSYNEANDALNALLTSSKTGKFTLGELATEMKKVGIALRDKMSFKEAVAGLAAFSANSSVTKDVARESFEAIAKAAQDPIDSLNMMLGGVNSVNDVLKEGGIVEAFKQIGITIQKYPQDAAVALGDQFGLTADSVSAFRDIAISSFDDIAKKQQEVMTNQISLTKMFDETKSFWSELKVILTTIYNTLGQIFSKAMGTIGDLFKGKMPDMSGMKSAISSIGSDFSGIGSFFSDLIGKIFGNSSNKNDMITGDNTKNVSITNNINMNVPKGGESQVSKSLVSEMYSQFSNK